MRVLDEELRCEKPTALSTATPCIDYVLTRFVWGTALLSARVNSLVNPTRIAPNSHFDDHPNLGPLSAALRIDFLQSRRIWNAGTKSSLIAKIWVGVIKPILRSVLHASTIRRLSTYLKEFTTETLTMSRQHLTRASAAGSSAPYSNDPAGNQFVELLVRVVEHCIAFRLIKEQHNTACEATDNAQSNFDDWNLRMQRYLFCEEPALDSLAATAMDNKTKGETILQHCKEEQDRASKALRTSEAKRKRLLARLFPSTQDFVNRVMVKEVQFHGLKITPAFLQDLSMLTWHAKRLQSSEKKLSRERRNVLKAQRAIDADPNNGTLKRDRKDAVAKYADLEATIARQAKSQLKREQSFFVRVAHPIFVEAGVLPSLAPPKQLSRQSEPEKIDSRPREKGSARNVVRATSPSPEREQLRTARKRLAKAQDNLKKLEHSYTQELANFLIAFDQLNKADFDRAYAASGREPYEVARAAATHEVQQAKKEYEDALREAKAANIDDVPLTPSDLGDRSEDGQASSCDSQNLRLDRQWYHKQKPGIQRWGADVARSGSPAGAEEAPRTPSEGAQLSPPRSRDGTPGIEVETSKGRVQRYEKLRDRKRKRVQEEMGELAGIEAGEQAEEQTEGQAAGQKTSNSQTEAVRAKRRCIIL